MNALIFGIRINGNIHVVKKPYLPKKNPLHPKV